MRCSICSQGSTEPGLVTVTLERGRAVLVFRNVPAEVCDNCGEEYLSAEVNEDLLRRADRELSRGVELELLDFAA